MKLLPAALSASQACLATLHRCSLLLAGRPAGGGPSVFCFLSTQGKRRGGVQAGDAGERTLLPSGFSFATVNLI